MLGGTDGDSSGELASAEKPGRLQLYVDDPVVSVRAKEDQAHETFDLVILWWLTLGLPLSWKQRPLTRGSEPHRWIGIDYTLGDTGAIMRLPPQFVADLLVLLEPICFSTGTISMSDLEVVIGKAARVAHVVPTAKPFVAGLWGGLGAARAEAASGSRTAPPWPRTLPSSLLRGVLGAGPSGGRRVLSPSP